MTQPRYTEEETEKVLELYDDGYSPHEIGEIMGRHHRSIISKLVHLGVYKGPVFKKKRYTTHKSLVRDIERLLDVKLIPSLSEAENAALYNLSKRENLAIIVDGLKRKLLEKESNG
jgi:hypothetical protein